LWCNQHVIPSSRRHLQFIHLLSYVFSLNVPLASVSFSNCRRSKYLHPILSILFYTFHHF
jgi:hypothetical protein